jgi:hypothetical protein
MDFPRKGKEMKKLLFALSALAALTLLAPAPGSAYDNIVGIMFTDPAVHLTDDPLISCTEGSIGVADAYVILLNPTMGSIWGYEFGFTVEGVTNFVAAGFEGVGPIDVGLGDNNHIVGLASAMPVNALGATLLATITVVLGGGDPVSITLTSADPTSLPEHPGMPVILGPADGLFTTGLSTVAGSVTAVINTATGCGEVVGSDDASWDAVKSLYR